MRALLVIAVILVLLAFAGWLAFDFSGNSASVKVQTQKIEEDTGKIVDKSKEFSEKVFNNP